ncbi:MAG: Ig-like domain-containing protein, partial [Planctomycetota bacterium]
LDCGPQPQDACDYVRKWAGDWAVMRGRFSNNTAADVWAAASPGSFTIRDSWSTGSGRFFFGAGQTSTPVRVSLLNNEVGDYDPLDDRSGHAIENENSGTLFLVDNKIYSRAGQPEPVEADSLVPTDLLALNNGYTVVSQYAPTPFDGKLLSIDDYVLSCATDPQEDCPDVVPPPVPTATDPLLGRSIYTVVDAATIQEVIDVASADSGLAAVHFTSGSYEVEQTLTIASGSDLLLVGDTAWTALEWTGTGEGPLLEIDAAQANGLTVKDLQFKFAGVLVKNASQANGAAFLSQIEGTNAGEATLVVEDMDEVPVDVVDALISGNDERTNTGMLFKTGGESLTPAQKPGTAVWSGTLLANGWDFDVINDTAGAKVLITTAYMEDSIHYLRVRGQGGAGDVCAHGAKLAAIVFDPADVNTVQVDDFPGNFSLVECWMFIQDEGLLKGETVQSDPAALAEGSRLMQTGTETVNIQAIGSTVRKQDPDAEHDVTSSADFMRLSGKYWDPWDSQAQTESLADIRIQSGVESPITQPSPAEEALLGDALNLLRTRQLPGFYDEGSSAQHQINFDKVFFWDPARYGLLLSGGNACFNDGECDDGLVCNTDYCDLSGLPTGVPGQCRATPADAVCEATDPSPTDGTVNVGINTILSWTAGTGATSHDVYFGTNPLLRLGAFKGNQTGTTYDPGPLLESTTYYWKINEVSSGGTTGGQVWSFTTVPAPPGPASGPIPDDGETDVSPDADLSWIAGTGADSHDVYFGTNPTPGPSEFQGSQTITTFDPGTLVADTYYWRIDEVNAGGITTGLVWSFTVGSGNSPPLAGADADTVVEGGVVVVAVLGNDTDAEGDTLTITGVTQGVN